MHTVKHKTCARDMYLSDFLVQLQVLRGHHSHRPAYFWDKVEVEAHLRLLLKSKGC